MAIVATVYDMNYVFFVSVLLPVVVHCSDPEVTTNLGAIRGKSVIALGKEVNQFLGIPYAKPPVSDLRFRKPEELTERWNGTLIAHLMPKSCIQNLDFGHFLGLQKSVGPDQISEDCLYLNIWTPSKISEDKLFPVMLWIHGGGFLIGSTSDFDGAKFSAITKTVVVIINYRLNLFGFIYGNSDEMPGNMGLYDQRLAIKWTNKNIKQFGGDPNQITIFGESAGSMSVSHQLMSQQSWPYFKRAILMSGVGMDYIQVDRKDWALRKCKALANLVGCNVDSASNEIPESTITCLRKKDAVELLKASSNETVMSSAPLLSTILGSRLPGHLFYPIFGEAFIPKPPRELWKQNQLKPNTDLLMGTVYHEIPVRSNIKENETPSDGMRRVYTTIPNEFITQEEIEEFIRIHFIGINETMFRNEAIQAATQLQADTFFQCPTNEFGEIFSSIESNAVYQLVFNYKAKGVSEPACELKYPCHASDLPFTFGQVTNTEDQRTSENWMNIYGHFAYTGTANWPKYYRTNENQLVPVYYEFKGDYQMNNTKIGFRYFRCKFWSSMALK